MLYEAVRDNLATLLAEASEVGRGLPRYVERDFAKYLECGVLAHGFARVSYESCKDELLVAFSCKGRGVCPSCNAKRAHVTAVHLVEQVLPHVPYRQWTLSFPHRVRWVLLKDVGLLSDVLSLFLRAVFALQRRRARRQGLRGGQVGAVSFIQFFGSALQVTPHFHSLVPDGVFVPWEGGVRFEALPPPTQAEVEKLLKVVRHRVLRLLEKRGALPAQGPEDALQAYQAHSLQQRLRWTEVDQSPPLSAMANWSSLPAATQSSTASTSPSTLTTSDSGELFTHELLLLGALTLVRTGGGTQLPGMRLRAKEAADEGHIHLLLPRISWRWVEVDDVRAQVLAAGEGPVHPCLARVRGLRPKERRRV